MNMHTSAHALPLFGRLCYDFRVLALGLGFVFHVQAALVAIIQDMGFVFVTFHGSSLRKSNAKEHESTDRKPKPTTLQP